MCLTFDDKCKTNWEGSTQELGALQLMNKTVHALSQQGDKLLQQMPGAGTVQELAEDFLHRCWQEMSLTRSWIAWTMSLMVAWLTSHLGRCRHKESRTEKKVFARARQVKRKQLCALLFASWKEMFAKMAAMTEAATKAATASRDSAGLHGWWIRCSKCELEQWHPSRTANSIKDFAQSRALRWFRST